MKKDEYLSELEEKYNSGEITLKEKSSSYEKYLKENKSTELSTNQDNEHNPNSSIEEQILNKLSKQTKILLEQHKLQKRISNNVLFFFWITIISLFIVPLMWIIFGLSVLL